MLASGSWRWSDSASARAWATQALLITVQTCTRGDYIRGLRLLPVRCGSGWSRRFRAGDRVVGVGPPTAPLSISAENRPAPLAAAPIPILADVISQMSFGERAALEGILGPRKPRLAIEIGTYEGGSLQFVAAHCAHVHTLDLYDLVEDRGAYHNVTFQHRRLEVAASGVATEPGGRPPGGGPRTRRRRSFSGGCPSGPCQPPGLLRHQIYPHHHARHDERGDQVRDRARRSVGASQGGLPRARLHSRLRVCRRRIRRSDMGRPSAGGYG